MVNLFYLLLMATACCGFDKLGAFQFRYFVSSSAELDPVYGVRLDSTVPAVDLALEYITNNSTLLPGITLNYGQAASQLQCPVALDDLPIDAYVGILGYSCSEDTYNTNSTTGIFNLTPMIQYTAAPVDDAFNSSETLLFSIHPSPRTYAEVLVSIIKRFGWQRIVTVTNLAGERFFIDVLESITLSLRIQDTNITLFKSDIMNSTAVTGELLTLPLDVRIVFLNVNSSNAVQIMCNASRAGHLFPHYVWIAYAGDYQRLAVNSTCGSDELAQFLEGVFTLLPTLSNETDQSFLHLASRLSYFAFDAVLVLAQALNDTLTGWSSTSTDCSFCEPASEQNMTLLAKCCIRQKIQNVNVSGVTGEIQFNLQGNRITQVVGLHQYRFQGTTTFPASEMIAVVRVDASSVDSVMSEFELLSGENETTIFNGPIPPDGTPLKHINAHPLSFVIVYYIIAAGGILFALVCLLFNIIFRKRKKAQGCQ